MGDCRGARVWWWEVGFPGAMMRRMVGQMRMWWDLALWVRVCVKVRRRAVAEVVVVEVWVWVWMWVLVGRGMKRVGRSVRVSSGRGSVGGWMLWTPLCSGVSPFVGGRGPGWRS